MEKDSDNTYYTLEDDSSHDDSPNPSGYYAIEEDEEEVLTNAEEAPGTSRKYRETAAGLFFRIMGAPVEGWKRLKRSRISPDEYAKNCFYPLLGLVALSQAANIFYSGEEIATVVQSALVLFITLFVSYFILAGLGAGIMASVTVGKFNDIFWRKFVLTVLSSLAFFYVIYTLAQPVQTFLVFLPLYTCYLIYRGVKYLRIKKERETTTAGLLCLFTIAMPIAVATIFYWILVKGGVLEQTTIQ